MDQKLTALTADTSPSDGDLIYGVKDPGGSPLSRKLTWTTIKAFLKTYFDTIYGIFVSTATTSTLVTVASKGGLLRNIDGAVGDTTVTTSTWVEDEKFGFYNGADANNNYAVFASSPTGTGRLVLKFGNTNTTGRTHIDTTAAAGAAILASNSHNILPAKPSTTYKFTYLYQTVTRTSATLCQFMEYSGLTRLGFINGNTAVVGTTNGWTRETIIFTTNASTDGLVLRFLNAEGAVEDNIIDVNSMTLTEYKPDTTSIAVPTKIGTSYQAITSTGNIDQSLDPTGAYANTYALTNAVNEGATHIHTFTPTKKYTTRIGVWVVEAGTGVDWTLVVHTAANVNVVSKTIAAASLVEGAFNYFDVPNIWASGALHFHLYASATTGTPTCKANTSDDLETASYIQNYAKKTESFSLIANGIKTELKADKDGLLSNAIIDLDNGKYRYYKCLTALTGTSFPIAISGDNEKFRTDLYSISGQYIGTNYPSLVFTSGYNTPMVLKVNTILPSKNINLKLLCSAASDRYYDVHYSLDNINWVALSVATNANDVQLNYNFNVNQPTFFVRIQNSSGSSKYLKGISIEADLDTSKIPQGLIYPLSTNQFTEQIKLPSVATRAYFRLNKFTNENGVVMPAIELTDGSAVTIGYIPLKIDNSLETNPAVAIVNSTTNYQAVGTGSEEGTTYILNNGEYMTFTGTVADIKMTYRVGKGTTAFSNITKNALYLSSNAESVDSTQDPSHQATFNYTIKNQGVVENATELLAETQNIKKGIADTQQLVRNNSLIVGFDAGTTDAYEITIPDFQGYRTGMSVLFRANTVNTGAATLNINGMGAKAIVKGITTALANADILALMWCQCVYDGTAFVLLNPRAL